MCSAIRWSLVAKNWQSILVAIFRICLAKFNRCSACTAASAVVAGWALSTSTLLCTSGCIHTNTAAGHPTRWHYQHISTFFDACRPSVVRWVIPQYYPPHDRRAILCTTVVPTIVLCIHPIIVTSTRQRSFPFAPFAGGGDTLVAAAVLTTRTGTAVWCG